MDNCLIVKDGGVVGLRTPQGQYDFPSVPLAAFQSEDRAFIKAFEKNPIKALQEIGAKFEVYHAGNQSKIDVESIISNTVQKTKIEVENKNYPLEYRYDIPFRKDLKKEWKMDDKISANLDKYRHGLLETNMLPAVIENAEGISTVTKELYDKYKNTYGDMTSENWDNFNKSYKLIIKIKESLLRDYYNYLKSIGYSKPFFTTYTGEIPDYVKENFKSVQETIEELPFSKSRESIQTKSIKQVLSDYDISFDSLPDEAKTRLTNNPELLNDSKFINALKC